MEPISLLSALMRETTIATLMLLPRRRFPEKMFWKSISPTYWYCQNQTDSFYFGGRKALEVKWMHQSPECCNCASWIKSLQSMSWLEMGFWRKFPVGECTWSVEHIYVTSHIEQRRMVTHQTGIDATESIHKEETGSTANIIRMEDEMRTKQPILASDSSILRQTLHYISIIITVTLYQLSVLIFHCQYF